MVPMPIADPRDEREVHCRPAEILPFDPPDLAPLVGRTAMAGHIPFLFGLTRGIAARHVVEIGLGGANSALCFLLALRETGGRLTSIDVAPCEQAAARIRDAGLDDRWNFIRLPSEMAVGQVASAEPIDVLMIDGKHSYGQCRRDYFRFAPLVRRGGYVLFHDSSTIEGVVRFTGELLDRGLGGVNHDWCNGLFVFRRADERIW